MKSASTAVLLLTICLAGSHAAADVHLARPFGSGMVLQRDMQAKLTGWADVGEKVTVTLGSLVVGQIEGQGKDKPWTLPLPAQPAGPVPELVIAGKNTITLTDLLAGDVWVCSGQSNMVQTLQKGSWCGYGGVLNAEQEVAGAGDTMIRLYKADSCQWEVCTPDAAKSFSAAAYFFGRELRRQVNTPVGLVLAAVGGTEAECWTPRWSREAWGGYIAEQATAKNILETTRAAVEADAKARAEWQADVKRATDEKRAPPPAPARHLTDEQDDQRHWANAAVNMGNLYESLIAPLTVMSIKGVIWYQGEGNSRRAADYPELMSQLIGGWRKAWGQGDFPFVIMGLVNFDFPTHSPWFEKATFAELRAAQQAVAETVPNCGLAVGIDIGDPRDIHPPNKQEVGRRLALVALKEAYGINMTCSGPRLTEARHEAGEVILVFNPGSQSERLMFKMGGGSSGFELAGADEVFEPAIAHIEGNKVILMAQAVSVPCTVRYAWADNPPVTLFNDAGLPAAPFKQLITPSRKTN